jgi:D-alanine-D-alanine ligase
LSLKNKRVGVMMGGLSAERSISLKSGMAVFESLKSSGWDVVALQVHRESEEEVRRLIKDAGVDVVFIAMHGGFGEDGRLQHILEKIPIPYTGPGEKASKMAMDKIASRRLFEKAGLHVPLYRQVKKKSKDFSIDSLRYPLMVKPSAQGSSIGISFVEVPAQLSKAIDLAFQFGGDVLIEEFIKGREVTVSVVDGNALPVVEIIPKKGFFDYQSKYEKGQTEYVVPACFDPVSTKRIQQDAVAAYQALNCRHLSRVDMIVGEDGALYVLEVNSIPGMTEMSLLPKAAKAAGITFNQLCQHLIELAIR